jgi:predicted O-methyltransferase YrrM
MNDLRAELAARLTSWAAHLRDDAELTALPAADEKQLRRLVADQAFHQQRQRCRLRELPLAAIFPGIDRQAVALGAINVETGHANHAEMMYVVAAAHYRQAKRIFEFGTYLGRSTYHFAAHNPDAQIWTLDLPRDANPWAFAGHVGAYFEHAPERARITRIHANSTSYDPGPLRGTMDFIWIDADHSYAGVKNDTEKAFQLLAPGGTIMWHDFGAESPQLVQFIIEFTATRPLFWIEKTSVLLHVDGVDPLTFTAAAVPFSKRLFKTPVGAGSTEGT